MAVRNRMLVAGAVLGAVLAVVVAAGCTPGPGQNRVERITWVLEQLTADGVAQPAAEGTVVDLRLEDGRAMGSGGVNRFTASYRLHETTLVFSRVASTKMGGPQLWMEQEAAFFAGLEATQYFRVEAGRLELLDSTRHVLLVFVAD